MIETFRCEACPATFDHPGVEDDCETVGGYCAHLVRAGWRAVWVRLLASEEGRPDRHVFSRGGWVCPECVTAYVDPPRQPRHRRRVRVRRHANRDRELS